MASHVCRNCGINFRASTALFRHMPKCKGEKRCRFCNVLVSSFKTLELHSREQHGQAAYKCDDCQKPFTMFTNFRNHFASRWHMRCAAAYPEPVCILGQPLSKKEVSAVVCVENLGGERYRKEEHNERAPGHISNYGVPQQYTVPATNVIEFNVAVSIDHNEQHPESTTGNAMEHINSSEVCAEELRNNISDDYMLILQNRIKCQVQLEYHNLLRTNEFIRHKFLVEMPPDFYAFWNFLGELSKGISGEELLAHISKQFHLELVGAFEFLAGRFHKATIHEPGDYLRHWRFHYDPPEFQTIFVRRGTGIHYGYWRDTPKDKDSLLIARNDATRGCEFEFVAGNAFDAFLHYLDKDFPPSPFTTTLVASTKKSLQHFLEANKVQVEKLETLHKARKANVVARTFHRAGIVVPLDEKMHDEHRSIIVNEPVLSQTLKLFESFCDKANTDDGIPMTVIDKLQEIARSVNIVLDKDIKTEMIENQQSVDGNAFVALDEGFMAEEIENVQPAATAKALNERDFATSLGFGIDLFSSGHHLVHKLAQSFIVPAYKLLRRQEFIIISKAHMERRSRKLQLSIFDLND